MAYTTINDPSEYFQTAIYSGNSSTLAVTSQGNATIAPDWVWVKRRNSTSTHALVDSSRGRAKSLGSEASDAEYNTSDTAKDLISFDTNGFTVGPANQRNMNGNGDTFVAWQWKANGGTTTTNDASSTSVGTIDSVYQANTTAGFSIVTYTGTGSAGTIAHGLGATPKLYIIKNRERSDTWRVATEMMGFGKQLLLNETDAVATDTSTFNNTAPTSTVFSVGTRNAVNASSEGHVAYCFAEKKGYSKFGSYTANGNASGPFVHTGFKPALIIIKRTDGAGNDWRIMDHKRDPDNIVEGRIKPNTTAAEDTNDQLDFLSNGFKLRSTAGDLNGTDGHTFIYIAFAETPFVSSTGTPTTAR